MNVTAVVIVAIICWAIVELVNGKRVRKYTKQGSEQNGALREEVKNLRERVEVLEKIVTDEKYNLNKEFENLKKDDAA